MRQIITRWWWTAPLAIGTLLGVAAVLGRNVQDQIRIEASQTAGVLPEQVEVASPFAIRIRGFTDPQELAAAVSKLEEANESWRVEGEMLPETVEVNRSLSSASQSRQPLPSVGDAREDVAAMRTPEVELVKELNFMLGKAPLLFDGQEPILRPEAEPFMREIAELIDSHPTGGSVKVVGYVDEMGDPVADAELGRERAESVIRCLELLEVDTDRLVAAGSPMVEPNVPDFLIDTPKSDHPIEWVWVGDESALEEP